MNTLPNNHNILAAAYMNGAPIAAGSNPNLPPSVMAMGDGAIGVGAGSIGNGGGGGQGGPGGLMIGQMPQNASQQAALYHYQQQLYAPQMNSPYGKMPAQMVNTGGAMMGIAQDGTLSWE